MTMMTSSNVATYVDIKSLQILSVVDSLRLLQKHSQCECECACEYVNDLSTSTSASASTHTKLQTPSADTQHSHSLENRAKMRRSSVFVRRSSFVSMVCYVNTHVNDSPDEDNRATTVVGFVSIAAVVGINKIEQRKYH